MTVIHLSRMKYPLEPLMQGSVDKLSGPTSLNNRALAFGRQPLCPGLLEALGDHSRPKAQVGFVTQSRARVLSSMEVSGVQMAPF